MATVWTIKETPKGCNYEVVANGTARVGEAVEFGYVAVLKSGSYSAPDSVIVTIAANKGDTAAATVNGSVASDTSTSTYTVTATLPSTTSASLSGQYAFEIEETRGTNETVPFGGCFYFDARVEA